LGGGVTLSLTPSAVMYDGEPQDWQLAAGHYEGYNVLHVIYPRPDGETATSSRHRHAYPGIKYEIPIGVQFGKWPYKYEKIAGPSWLNIEAETLQWDGVDKFVIPEGYGVLSGTAPGSAQAAETVTVRVYDQDHNRPSPSFVDVTFSVAVSASNFVFVDPVNGNDGTATGLIGAPYRELSAVFAAGTHGSKICYIRQTPTFDADTSTFAGGYSPVLTSNVITTEGAAWPTSLLGYPGEYVGLNLAHVINENAMVRMPDSFFSNLDIRYHQQSVRTQRNPRVFSWPRAERVTYWKLTFVRPYIGTHSDDNHGCMMHRSSGNSNLDLGHVYVYGVNCHGIDLGRNEGAGYGSSNGPSLFGFYSNSRVLLERNSTTQSRGANNGLIIFKRSADRVQARANLQIDNYDSQGRSMVLVAYVRHDPYFNDGYMRNIELCWNKTICNNLTDGMAQIGDGGASYDPSLIYNMVTYRNTMAGGLWGNPPLAGTQIEVTARRNIVMSVPEDRYIDDDNFKMVTSAVRTASINAQGNLIGSARTQYLGTHGAEVA
jgi:hypothetical protein